MHLSPTSKLGYLSFKANLFFDSNLNVDVTPRNLVKYILLYRFQSVVLDHHMLTMNPSDDDTEISPAMLYAMTLLKYRKPSFK